MSKDEYNPNSIDAVLSRIETKQTQTHDALTDFIGKQSVKEADQYKRIGRLERAWASAAAVAGIIGIGVQMAWHWITTKP